MTIRQFVATNVYHNINDTMRIFLNATLEGVDTGLDEEGAYAIYNAGPAYYEEYTCGCGHVTKESEEYTDICNGCGCAIDPEPGDEYIEVYEHYVISEYLARLLEAHGEKVLHNVADFSRVWCRTVTGQHITMDHVIEAIYSEQYK